MNKKDLMKCLNNCAICTKKAVGYHYGAYVCEACKKFFIRHSSGICRLYGTCQENGKCDLTISGRGKCQHCRFKKCTDIGMSIEYKSSDYNLTTIPCQVCGAKSSGLHFGCITCEGCKGFFRRMVKFKGLLVCFNNNNCEMNSNTRSACKSCRLERCLQIGMSRKGIRIGRHPNSLKYNCINSIKQAQSPVFPSNTHCEESPANTNSHISSFDNEELSISDVENVSDYRINVDAESDTQSNIPYGCKDEIVEEGEKMKTEWNVFINPVNLPLETALFSDANLTHVQLDYELFFELKSHIAQIINSVSPSSVFLSQKELKIIQDEKENIKGSDSSQNVWSAMMDHFVFHSQFIVKFAKLIPGFSKLSLTDKKIVIKDSMYSMILLELSQSYSEKDGEIFFNYFDFSSSDRDIILDFFPEFIDFSDHLKRCGSIKHMLELNGVEMTLLCGIIMFYNYRNLTNNTFGKSMMILYQEFLMVYFIKKLGFSEGIAHDRWKMCMQFIVILNEMNSSHHRIITDFCASHHELQYPDLYIEIFNN